MKNYLLLSSIIGVLLGCTTASFQSTSANISAEAAQQIIDGSSSRTDILALFGEPNGFMPTANGGAMSAMQLTKANAGGNGSYNNIMHYKNCIMKSSSKISGLFSFGYGVLEVCDTLTVLLDSQDTVIAYSYIDNNIVDADRINKIQQGVSNRIDVIRELGGPISIVPSKNKEIYLYKYCVSTNSYK